MPFGRLSACIALCSVVACTGLGKKPTRPDLQPWPEIRTDFRVETLRARLFEYSITFAAEVDLAAAAIERRTSDATIRRNALLWRVRAIPEMRKACFRLEPVSGLIDAWTFAHQMHQLFKGDRGAAVFGPFQGDATAVARRLLDQVSAIGGSIVTSPDARAAFEQRIIEPWLTEHPLSDLTFVRDSPVARFAEQSRDLGDVVQSVGTMEELAVTLAQQARLYLADMPRFLRGEVELMRFDILADDGLVSALGDAHAAAEAAERIASTVETLGPLAEKERKMLLDEVRRQRTLLMEALSAERERMATAAVGAFAAERNELLRTFEAQRLATLEWVTAERREAIAQVLRELSGTTAALKNERTLIVADLQGIADRVLLRVALFLMAAVVLAPLVAHVYAFVWPRRARP